METPHLDRSVREWRRLRALALHDWGWLEVDIAAECIRGTKYPQADEFAANNVLQPPSETQMLGAFTRVELK